MMDSVFRPGEGASLGGVIKQEIIPRKGPLLARWPPRPHSKVNAIFIYWIMYTINICDKYRLYLSSQHGRREENYESAAPKSGGNWAIKMALAWCKRPRLSNRLPRAPIWQLDGPSWPFGLWLGIRLNWHLVSTHVLFIFHDRCGLKVGIMLLVLR